MDASPVICTSCGQESPAASRYCGTCGALLTGTPPDVGKTVTVVFCDLVGSTALGESTDPEVLRELMTRYHAELRAILERHLLERRGNKALLSEVAGGLAEAAVRQGSLGEAERFCELCEASTASEDVESEAHIALLRAKVRAARSELVAAEDLARRAVEIYSGTDYLERAADAWLTLAEILCAKGDPGDTSAAAEALRLYEAKGNLVGAGWAQSFLEG